MQGTMIWFNEEKGYGYIRTEDEERLFVDRDGFLPGQQPQPRCKGLHVSFERQVGEDGDVSAVNVAFTPDAVQRRARLRHARGGTAL